MRTYQFIIGSAEAGLRVDRYLAQHLPASVSRSMIQRGIREGLVLVDDRPVKAHHKVRRSDVVTARFDHLPAPPRDLDMAAQDIPLDVVYEDADLLVVNKPPGLVTHPAPGHWDGTLVNAILWHLHQAQHPRRFRIADCGLRNDLGQVQSAIHNSQSAMVLARAGIVHRLDKDTSGLLLVAKTEAAHHALSRQLKARTMRRRYLALVEGHLPLDTGTINVPIGRHLTHRKEMTIRHLGGRVAVTHYRVIRRLMIEGSGLSEISNFEFRISNSKGNPQSAIRNPQSVPCTLIEVSLETGRTHQIRVHMAHLGHPVLGDSVYGRRPHSYWTGFGISRQLLHAYTLRFVHPATRVPIEVSAGIPEDMARWVSGLPARQGRAT